MSRIVVLKFCCMVIFFTGSCAYAEDAKVQDMPVSPEDGEVIQNLDFLQDLDMVRDVGQNFNVAQVSKGDDYAE